LTWYLIDLCRKSTMHWRLISLAGALSLSGVSALADPSIKTTLVVHPREPLHVSEGIEDTVAQHLEKRNTTTPNFYSRSLHYLVPRQAAGRCGADFSNQRCGGNQCCSSYGYCGTEFEVCAIPTSRFHRKLTGASLALRSHSWMSA